MFSLSSCLAHTQLTLHTIHNISIHKIETNNQAIVMFDSQPILSNAFPWPYHMSYKPLQAL